MRGRILTLIGVDGAGKSTQARRLVAAAGGPATRVYLGSNPSALTHALPSTRAWAWIERALGRGGDHRGPPEPSRPRAPPAGAAARLAQHAKSLGVLALRASDELYRLLLAEWLARRGHLVVLDRHPYADWWARRVRGREGWMRWGDRVHAFLLARVYPRPAHVVLLDAPAEALHARKPEGSLEALGARRREYLELARALPPGTLLTVVDASRPEEEVAAALLRIARAPPPERPERPRARPGRRRAVGGTSRSAPMRPARPRP